MSGPTYYLVVGAGASGLAFVDALVAEADAEVTLVDRRPASGGHWLDAYPFVRLHTPSAYYGVNSLALGEDRIDRTARTRALRTGDGRRVREYFAEAQSKLTAHRQVRLLPEHDHVGRGRRRADPRPEDRRAARGRASSQGGRRALPGSVGPGDAHPTFDVAPGARVVPSTSCRPPRDTPSPTPCSARARRRWTRAPGCWTTAWSRIGSAGFGRATPGFTTAPFPAAGAGRRDHGRHLPRCRGRRRGDRHRRPVRSARGLRPALAHRPVVARDDVPRHDAQRPRAATPFGRSTTSSGSVGFDGSRATGSFSSGASLRRARHPARGLHRARLARRARPCLSSSPAGSCSNRCGTTRRRSTRPSWGSSRPTGTMTPRRTGSARPTHMPAASTTGHE